MIGGLALLTVVASGAVVLATVVIPPLTARPVYSVSQVWADLTPRHNILGGRSAWVRAVAILAPEKGPDVVKLTDYGPRGPQNGFYVSVKSPNLTFTLLSWQAAIAHALPGMNWLYGQHPGVYRIRFFQANWCFSCAKGQLE